MYSITLFFSFLILAFDFCRFCVVNSFFFIPRQRPMTSDFEGFLSQIWSITFLSYLYSWESARISLSMLSAKLLKCHFYNVFGMTWSLTGDWTQDLSHSIPSTQLLGYRAGVCVSVKLKLLLLEICEIVCSVNLDLVEEDVCTHLNMDCILAGKPFCNLKYI